jgi:hypothetical protein
VRARASTRGHSFSADPFGLRDFRDRGDPRVPLVPAPDLDGKEGVNGSSPLEGLRIRAKKEAPKGLLVCLEPTLS